MIAYAAILDGPITSDAEAAALGPCRAELNAQGEIGAILRFDGVVRRLEGGRPLEALDYQTYDPMALRELQRLTLEIAQARGLTALLTLHSRGRVAVGETSFVLIAYAHHRRETLAAVTDFIDRLKQEVPIWKSQVWSNQHDGGSTYPNKNE